jgi:hypothetical protein
MNGETRYIFITPTTKRVRPIKERFIPTGTNQIPSGFRSTFTFAKTDVDRIVRQRNFRDLRDIELGCDKLLVDFDNNPLAAWRFRSWLDSQTVNYELYYSGNRSIHVELITVPFTALSTKTIAICLGFVRKYAEGCDESVYKVTGLFRLPGTYHEKCAGRRKTLLANVQGRPLDFTEFMAPISVNRRSYVAPSRKDDVTAKRLLTLALQDVIVEGGRRPHVWRIGTLASDAGIEFAQALELAEQWNEQCASPPLAYDQVEHKIFEAYTQRGYG